MMPLLMGLDAVWRTLESLEREHRTAGRRPGFTYHDDFDDQQARSGRLQRVRNALFFSGVAARDMLTARLSGIDLSTVIEVLLNACKDVAVCWGGSVLAGGAVGGAIGAFAGGVGAVPGAAIGAGLGAQVGAWVLGVLGLKALIEDLGTAVPNALRHYEAGFRMAWGPVRHWEDADSIGMDGASHELARGHVLLMMAMLSALAAYLTRGRGDPAARARILQEIRESPRLGSKVADWVAANEEALTRHPGLKPKEQQVMMSSQAKPPAGPPMTPSQLRKAMRQADEDLPAQKKSGLGNATEAAKSPLPRREITAPNGRVVTVATKGGAMVPIDKVAVYARGGSPDVSKELSALQAFKQQNRKNFDLDPANQTRLDQLKNMQHNYERSQEMARNLDAIGLPNTPENNEHIMRSLLETAQGVTPERRVWVPGTLTGPGGSLRVNSTWAILPDGTKYLSSLRFMPIGD